MALNEPVDETGDDEVSPNDGMRPGTWNLERVIPTRVSLPIAIPNFYVSRSLSSEYEILS